MLGYYPFLYVKVCHRRFGRIFFNIFHNRCSFSKQSYTNTSTVNIESHEREG